MFSRLLLTTLTFACALPLAAHAQAPAAASQPVTRAELPALIKEALMNEPEMIMEAVKKLREKSEAEAAQKAAEALVKYQKDLFNNPEMPSTGPANADVTIVEFFDYHCGYCKHMLPVINQTLQEDKKVRFVFVEFPILSEDSVLAARAALAVNRIAKDKYFDFHQELMKASGKFEESTLLEMAKKVGVDPAKVKTEMAKPEITTILDKNREMAGAMNISGTPGLILGGEVTPGAVDYDMLKKMIAATRSGKKPSEVLKEETAPAN